MDDALTRRRFLQALVASVVAAGVPLPVGVAPAAAERFVNYIDARFQRIFEETGMSSFSPSLDTRFDWGVLGNAGHIAVWLPDA